MELKVSVPDDLISEVFAYNATHEEKIDLPTVVKKGIEAALGK